MHDKYIKDFITLHDKVVNVIELKLLDLIKRLKMYWTIIKELWKIEKDVVNSVTFVTSSRKVTRSSLVIHNHTIDHWSKLFTQQLVISYGNRWINTKFNFSIQHQYVCMIWAIRYLSSSKYILYSKPNYWQVKSTIHNIPGYFRF